MLLIMGGVSSCNDKKETTEEIAVTISTVAVKSFTLKADTKVLTDLDSVFFSIDLDNGVIFNADSLPKGTNIEKLVPVITFMTTMSKADLVYTDAVGVEKTVNYLETTTDSINFSSPVTLNVTAYDGETNYSYRLKVNVHQQEPDSLMWSDMAVGNLPSRLPSPVAQRSVQFGSEAVSLIEENDGSYTLSTSSQLYNGDWEKEPLTLPFTPEVASLTASDDTLWMLADDGSLFTSTDAKNWSDTGEKWLSITGLYMESVLGIRLTDTGLTHCHYPASQSIADLPVAADFPVKGISALVSAPTKWATEPTAFFVGGVKADGSLSNATWAFDGSVWARIDNVAAPALDSPTIVRYVNYRNTESIFYPQEAEAWLLIGGRDAEGNMNRTVYFTHDNGVTWKAGSSLMQLPEYVPGLRGADAIVMDASHSSSITDYWKSQPAQSAGRWLKPAYVVEGYDIIWECPYIYLIGGYDSADRLSCDIWKGVLARLRFTPLF